MGMRTGWLAALLLCAAAAHAQNYPNQPIKLIVPWPPGGGVDTSARIIAQPLSERLGQGIVIENRGGAGGMIGTETAAKSLPDGYTFLLTPGATLTILPHLRQTPYDAFKSFEPVGRVGDLVSGFVIHPAVGVKTFKELIEYAKKNPGTLAYGSAGLGTATHLRIEMLKFKAGVDILHVPYRGSADALNDLLPNTIQMMNEINVLPHVKAGKLILLNVNFTQRHPDFPDVPTLTECGYANSDVPIWYSLFAPAGTPTPIVAKLNAKILEIANSQEMRERMRSINTVVPAQTPEEVVAYLEEDTARNVELIKATNMKLE